MTAQAHCNGSSLDLNKVFQTVFDLVLELDRCLELERTVGALSVQLAIVGPHTWLGRLQSCTQIRNDVALWQSVEISHQTANLVFGVLLRRTAVEDSFYGVLAGWLVDLTLTVSQKW